MEWRREGREQAGVRMEVGLSIRGGDMEGTKEGKEGGRTTLRGGEMGEI